MQEPPRKEGSKRAPSDNDSDSDSDDSEAEAEDEAPVQAESVLKVCSQLTRTLCLSICVSMPTVIITVTDGDQRSVS